MRWIDKMNERANLMGRMLNTIGAMDSMPEGMSAAGDLRLATSRCMNCEHADICVVWLKDHQDGADQPLDLCPNASLFGGWISKKENSKSQ